MLRPDQKTRVHRLAEEMAAAVGLEQGSFEVHFDQGKPTRMHVTDKSIKFEDSPKTK
jgi:hypothetical protein